MTDKILIAFKSIGKNKNRNFLTMLGIIIGIASVICILAIGDGFAHTVTKGMGNHNTRNKVVIMYQPTTDDNTDGGFTNNDEAITNHAFNPNTNPSTNAYEPLNYINEQQASKNNSANKVTNNLNADVKATDTSADTVTKTMTAGKLRGYEKLLSLLNSDITEKFLAKFGPLFQKVINLNPFLYESEE